MKNKYLLLILTILINAGCATNVNKVSSLVSFDEVIKTASQEIESRIKSGSEIAIYKFTAPSDEIGDFLVDELNDCFVNGKKLTVLARGKLLEYVNQEHDFQMSGYVSDESAVGIGHYLGAKVIITGTFHRYAGFSQFRLRAVDVLTSALITSYTARIQNTDPVLADITANLGNTGLAQVSEDALNHLNQGKDLFAEGRLEAAIQEFDRALSINQRLAEAYFYRGLIYENKGDLDKAIVEWTHAIHMDSNYVLAYNNRGVAFYRKGDYVRAIPDFTEAIRLHPDNAIYYFNRGYLYTGYTRFYRRQTNYGGDINLAIADFTEAIRLDTNYADAYAERGRLRYFLSFIDSSRSGSIEDLETMVKTNPNNQHYKQIFDMRRSAIEDLEAALKLDPNNQDYRLINYMVRYGVAAG